MNKKNLIKIVSIVLAVVLVAGIVLTFVLCGGKKTKKDSIVIMTEELSGLFNPFYATSGADMDVVGMTQIGMLSTNSEGKTVAGDDYATVVKAFDYEEVPNSTNTGIEKTVYTFVIKNGLKFSNGSPLTMNDVLFNMYEYLDPVYTGSSTMYSIDIQGLVNYRTQTNYSGDAGSSAEDDINEEAESLAYARVLELITLYQEAGLIEGSQSSYSLNESAMKQAISNWEVSEDYKLAVADENNFENTDFNAQLKKDYEFALKTFKEELESDYRAAKESFDTTTAPYNEWAKELESDVFKFLLYEGRITPNYAKIEGTSRDDKNKILSFENAEMASRYDKDGAINLVYNANVTNKLHEVLSYWGTAGTLRTQFAAEAKDIILHKGMSDGELKYKNVSGIVSLGHTTDVKTVNVKGTTYNVAREHNADGTVKGDNVYDVLRITVNGVDPKAIYSFGFTVAPAYYYSGLEIDIKHDKFGVEFASSDFQGNVIQAQTKQEVPVGAGPFVATNKNNEDNPKGSDFNSANIVYFKANDNFMFEVKAKKLRLQVVSSSNAIDALRSGAVDYVTPQFTKDNATTLEAMKKDGFNNPSGWQLGYGYIGINAGKVPDVNIRRAIMSAMDTSLALQYYESGTCKKITWPMSQVSWAYPFADDGVTDIDNGHDYTQWLKTGTQEQQDARAKEKIQKYMDAANNGSGATPDQLKIKFTIAGSSITEHPVYEVFKHAQELLNSMGWDIEVKADSQALTKLATGSLTVWAAAWGSTIDPDMYQVYHKNSTATSVYSWGYREIKADKATYDYEYKVIEKLSVLIEEGRSVSQDELRIPIYQQAMEYVLDLAVELPVYQRMTLYAYNTKTIKGLTVYENNSVNPYSSPLEKIWELELVQD